MDILSKIKDARIKKNLTQKELASLIHKTESSVQKYESGTTILNLDTLMSICDILELKFYIDDVNNSHNNLIRYINSKCSTLTDSDIAEITKFIDICMEFYKNKL